MFDAGPPTTTGSRSVMEALEDVEDERVGAIADRVDDGLLAAGENVANQLFELVWIVDQKTSRAGIVGVRLEERRGAGPHRPVGKELPPATAQPEGWRGTFAGMRMS